MKAKIIRSEYKVLQTNRKVDVSTIQHGHTESYDRIRMVATRYRKKAYVQRTAFVR